MQPPESLKKLDDWRVLARTDAQQQEYEAKKTARGAIARRLAPPLFLVVGLVLLVVAVLASAAVWRLERSGVRVPGVVSSLDASHCGSQNLSVCFHAVVTYSTNNGQRVSFRDGYGSNPPAYRVGQGVTVLYRPNLLSRAIVDRGIWNWIGAIALYSMGGVFILFGFAILAKFPRSSGGRR
jgi:hypothetical protein